MLNLNLNQKIDTALLLDDKTPVSRFKLASWGVNHTDKGAYVINDVVAERMLQAYTDKYLSCVPVKRLPINYDHDYRDVHGFHDLEVIKGDGIYAVNINYDVNAFERLQKQLVKYPSAEYVPGDMVTVDGIPCREIVEYVGLALTNYPAQHVVETLALSKTVTEDLSMMNEKVSAELKAKYPDAEVQDIAVYMAGDKLFMVEFKESEAGVEFMEPVEIPAKEVDPVVNEEADKSVNELSQLRLEVETLSRQLFERDIDDVIKVAVSQGVSPAQGNVMKQLALSSKDTRSSLTLLSGLVKDAPKVKLNAKVIAPVEESGEVTVEQYRKMSESEKKQLFVDNKELALRLSKSAW